MPELILYYFEECPYCQKVLDYIKKNEVEVTLRNTRKDHEARRELEMIGGKYQVPCLLINGSPLYESDDIIRWFQENNS
ncbi:glutaredoxin family protein [Halothermothrix orenii]|uniref:Glutaredoxin n=1 Tax=Halothermothrix orenii (strain H 168 / OCM 544 / DSM 9562) TaxID=373903 RepID=B8CX51_HALOH|nr:glutathione S-transferase N-terminal domain-containing protein [Halothermothrix orenii]ACL69870.1 glutaredoxin [Halothermothrix orenii H 168]